MHDACNYSIALAEARQDDCAEELIASTRVVLLHHYRRMQFAVGTDVNLLSTAEVAQLLDKSQQSNSTETCIPDGYNASSLHLANTDYRLQITKWPHKGGARNGAKLGSMGIIHHARLIDIIISQTKTYQFDKQPDLAPLVSP